jgi:fumarate reductase (CoM/CoB) subunit A
VDGKDFLPGYCPPGVAPAAVVDAKAMSYPFSVRTIAKYLDIAIFKELMAGRGTSNDGIFLDVAHVGEKELRQRAPITYETLKRAGADLAQEKIELGLVVQNFNGGILIDADGHTGVDGLYAAGEVTGGVHGADRPGGNNLIDTQVFGFRAGRAASAYAQAIRDTRRKLKVPELSANSFVTPAELMKLSADLYYRQLTIVRTAEGLRKVLQFIAQHKCCCAGYAALNCLQVGSLLALAALTREESRGTHYREDFPDRDSKWNQRITLYKGANGEPAVRVGLL